MTEETGIDLLWENFRRGDKSSFEEIYKNNAPTLVSYGMKVTANKSLVEDCIQDLFIELWKSRKKLSSTTSVRFYLFKALRYKLLRSLSVHHRMATLPVEDYQYLYKSDSSEDVMIEMEVQSEQMKHLRQTLEKLPERQREAIVLRYFHNFSNEEIASIMGINYHSACKLLYAGIANLKEDFKLALVGISCTLAIFGILAA